MPRPPKCRIIDGTPGAAVFKPAGIPKYELQEVILTLDEFESVRLADFLGQYQEQAAASMGVSRQTFGNILVEAHRKIADCLVNGKALRIEGGTVEMNDRIFNCSSCGKQWNEPHGTGRPERCPNCRSESFHRSQNDGADRRQCIKGRRQFRGGEEC